MSLSFLEARETLIREVSALAKTAIEEVPLDEAFGRVLAAAIRSDRDQPPFDRVTRDGFAVRSADLAGKTEPVTLAVIGEAPPGRIYPGRVGPSECVEIMTGAPLPAGADAVVMVEFTERVDGGGRVIVKRPVVARENVVDRGAEIRAGTVAFEAGRRLDASAVALAASVGSARLGVFVRPRVAIITTGDELVRVDEMPAPAQIRNSNLHSLAAQIAEAGAVPLALPIARDEPGALRALLEEGFDKADVVVLSGGVSMGKYDYVEPVLAELGARIVFDSAAIRPGKPIVFGVMGQKPFFGLPGNPLSTLVTFRLFVWPALDLLGGAVSSPLAWLRGSLAGTFSQRKLPLTVFVPAELRPDLTRPGDPRAAVVHPLAGQGSGDLVTMARADCLMVVEPGVTELPAGAWVPVLPK
jgi:molybdopterin molybdotransferase